ncbi:MAG: hypothetical protein ACYSUX_12545 [Planctomycetota bacterium]|jgi:hypothetical protein
MTDKEKEFENFVRDIRFDDMPDYSHREKLEQNLIAALARQPQQEKVWRIIMRNPLTKLAVAAVIIIAALLLKTFIPKTETFIPTVTTKAYGLEQTIEANHGIRTIHARFYSNTERLENGKSDLCWIRYNDEGLISNFRWKHTEDDGSLCDTVWNEGIYKCWMPLKNSLIVREHPKFGFWGYFTKTYNPMLVLEQLYADSQNDEAVKLIIREPIRDGDPIHVEAKNDKRNTRVVLLVDPETKLIKELTTYYLNNPKDKLGIHVEYLSYNQPIDGSVFELNAIPDDVRVFDYINEIIGLEQSDLTDDEIAVKVVRTALEATIAQDYDEASKLMEGGPERTIEEFIDATSGAKRVELISIGQPESHKTWPHMLCVSCEIKVEDEKGHSWIENITVTTKKIKQPGNRWLIAGEDPSHSPVINPKNSVVKGSIIPIIPGERVGNLTLGMSKDDVLDKLGKPNDISWKGEHFTLDNLPRTYYMGFGGGIFFMVHDDTVRVIGLVKPFYKFANGLGVGDSEQSIIQAFGDDFELNESVWKDQIIYEDKGLKFEIHKEKRIVTGIDVCLLQ